MKALGLEGWIDIFKGDTQTDSQGKQWDGDWLIDRALAQFDPADYEPPVHFGHPKGPAPILARVKELRKLYSCGAQFLQARFGDKVPELIEVVKKGLFKNRSAAFAKDGTLRHVAFLGAVPPAVKGLRPISFAFFGEDRIMRDVDLGARMAEHVNRPLRTAPGVAEPSFQEFVLSSSLTSDGNRGNGNAEVLREVQLGLRMADYVNRRLRGDY